jgi:hypothetical protein
LLCLFAARLVDRDATAIALAVTGMAFSLAAGAMLLKERRMRDY